MERARGFNELCVRMAAWRLTMINHHRVRPSLTRFYHTHTREQTEGSPAGNLPSAVRHDASESNCCCGCNRVGWNYSEGGPHRTTNQTKRTVQHFGSQLVAFCRCAGETVHECACVCVCVHKNVCRCRHHHSHVVRVCARALLKAATTTTTLVFAYTSALTARNAHTHTHTDNHFAY